MGDAFEFGPYRLDVGTSVLWLGDKVVDLPPKALALLQALVEHHGDVVSKQELMSRVWPDTVVEEANLSVTVALLRKTIDPQADGSSHIQTLARRGYRFVAPVHGGASLLRPNLAVLPFLALGPEVEPHLGLGLADALIRRLAVLPELVVRPTTAVIEYAGVTRGPREIAQELGVDAVVVGTIQRSGQRLRVSLQMVPRPASMRPWADAFDTDWGDLFQVQDELADRVVDALEPHVTLPEPSDRRAPRHKASPEVYETHLRGRYFWARLDVDGISKAFGCFGEAALADSEFSEPHASLSAAHIILGFAEVNPPRACWRLAEECAQRALTLDPQLAEAHVSQAYVALFRDWDWNAARASLDRACALAPGASEWRLWRALYHTIAGNPDRACQDIDRHRESDPLSSFGSAVATLASFACRDRPPAIDIALRAVDLRPERFVGHWVLALTQLELDRPEDACRSMRRAVALSGDGPVMRTFLAYALARAGKREDALAIVETVAAPQLAALRARVHAALGETRQACVLLEEAAERREPWVVFLGTDRAWASLATEARFVALRERVLDGER